MRRCNAIKCHQLASQLAMMCAALAVMTVGTQLPASAYSQHAVAGSVLRLVVAEDNHPGTQASVFSAPVSDEDIETALTVLTTPSQATNAELQAAWKTVSQGSADQILQMLGAIHYAEPLGANWISMAIDSSFSNAGDQWNEEHVNQLVEFVLRREGSPLARKTAYALLQRADAERATNLIDEMLNDPVAEFRRPGVAQLIEAAQALAEEEADEEQQLEAFEQALQFARDEDQVRVISQALEGLGHPIELADHFGFIRKWNVLGPFPNPDGEGYDTEFEPEELVDVATAKEVLANADDTEYQGSDGSIQWSSFESDARSGNVDLNKAIAQESSGVGYGVAIVSFDGETEAEMRLRVQNAFKVWINGELMLAQPVGHTGNFFDQYKLNARFRAGENVIVIKSCQTEPLADIDFFKTWHFGVRFTDSSGAAIDFGEE